MRGKGKEEKDKDETAGNGPLGFAEQCQRMMTAEASESCGSQMLETMSRCMASSTRERGKPDQSGGEGGKE